MRIADMDEGQIVMSPAQFRKCHDQLATAMHTHLDGFAGFAGLPKVEP